MSSTYFQDLWSRSWRRLVFGGAAWIALGATIVVFFFPRIVVTCGDVGPCQTEDMRMVYGTLAGTFLAMGGALSVVTGLVKIVHGRHRAKHSSTTRT